MRADLLEILKTLTASEKRELSNHLAYETTRAPEFSFEEQAFWTQVCEVLKYYNAKAETVPLAQFIRESRIGLANFRDAVAKCEAILASGCHDYGECPPNVKSYLYNSMLSALAYQIRKSHRHLGSASLITSVVGEMVSAVDAAYPGYIENRRMAFLAPIGTRRF